jgi:1,4-alpha-glucan branching enzyme
MPREKSLQGSKRRRVTFSLEAPGAQEVLLGGNFNEWNAGINPLKNQGADRWKRTVLLAPGSYEYKFMVDGQWIQDPANQKTIRFSTRYAALVVPATEPTVTFGRSPGPFTGDSS